MDWVQGLRRDAHLATLSPDERAAFIEREEQIAGVRRAERAARRDIARAQLRGHEGGKGFGFDG